MVNVKKLSTAAPLVVIFCLFPYIPVVNAAIAELGACFHHDTNSYRCAMNSDFCNSDYDEVWIKPYNLKNLDGRKLCSCSDAHIGNCSPSHGHRGNCAHEELACPADNAYFRRLPYFYNDGASCMCHGMVAHTQSSNTIRSEATTYGACKNGSDLRCAVYSTDCDSGTERWLSPSELYALGEVPCTCDMVRTGSCVIGPSKMCAVSNDSCASGSAFNDAKTTKENGLDCFLCNGSQIGKQVSTDGDDKANADDDDKAKADDDDKANADDDDKANADDDDKANADDDDKANADDDDKAKGDDDDGGVRLASRVSKKQFGVVLGFMITSLCTSMVLAVFVVIQRKTPSSEGTKTADGSVV